MWGKYADLLRKNTKIRGKRWRKRGKEENFTVFFGKKYDFKERGRGAKISIIWIIYTPGMDITTLCTFFGD